MLAHVKRREMLTAVLQAAKAAPRASSVEAVKGIHIEADSRHSMLTMTATNYEIAIRASIPASVERSGSAVVSARLFPEIMSKLPEEDVDLELLGSNRLSVLSGCSHFKLDVLPGERYPMPEFPFPDDTLPVQGICSLASQTVFAASEGDSTAPLMRCVRLTIGPDGLKAAASNGFCIMEAEGDRNCKGEIQLLLPASSLKTLASISSDSDVYEMGLAGKNLVFWNGTLLFSARLVEGNYPDTGSILNRFESKYSVHVDAGELRHAIEAVAVVAEKNARVELAFGEHEIILSADTAYGRSSAPVKCLVLNGPAAPFYYNYKKLLEYLSLEKGKITLEFDSSGILVIRPGSTRYLQSPMRAPNKVKAGIKKAA